MMNVMTMIVRTRRPMIDISANTASLLPRDLSWNCSASQKIIKKGGEKPTDLEEEIAKCIHTLERNNADKKQ